MLNVCQNNCKGMPTQGKPNFQCISFLGLGVIENGMGQFLCSTLCCQMPS